MNTIQINQVEDVLRRLHKDAKKDYLRIGKGVVKSAFRPMEPADFKHAYLPISQEQGVFIRDLIVKENCQQVVEFGTSFGISTIYMADAVRQTGGKVITTELLKSKAERAAQNITEAGLADYVDIKVGDAMETLKDHAAPIDFLFLDGWKDLYLPLFRLLESQFHKGTLIYADNMDMEGTRAYANYVLENSTTYHTRSVDSGKAFLTRVS